MLVVMRHTVFRVVCVPSTLGQHRPFLLVTCISLVRYCRKYDAIEAGKSKTPHLIWGRVNQTLGNILNIVPLHANFKIGSAWTCK